MGCYLISYDLRVEKDSEGYKKLYEKIKSYGTWAHVLESLWAVVTDKTASDVFDDIKPCLDEDDGLIVVKSAGQAKWRKVDCKDSWLKNNL